MEKKKSALRQFFASRRAYGKFEQAACNLMPHIYNGVLSEKIAKRRDWLAVVGKDAPSVLHYQWELAGKPPLKNNLVSEPPKWPNGEAPFSIY